MYLKYIKTAIITLIYIPFHYLSKNKSLKLLGHDNKIKVVYLYFHEIFQ